MLLAGLLLGIAARLFDIYFQNLGEIFSQMAIWILLGTGFAIYSPTKKAAMENIFPFCMGMLATYFTLWIPFRRTKTRMKTSIIGSSEFDTERKENCVENRSQQEEYIGTTARYEVEN